MDTNELLYYAARIIALMIAIPIHESSHAVCALALGDDTAQKRGRITLNPLKHFDLIGAISLMLIGVGWAKPVPINPTRFKNRKLGMALSSLAGPVSNLVLSYVFFTMYKICQYAMYAKFSSGWRIAALLFYYVAFINASLCIFNLLPIPPFDGSRIFLFFLPEKYYWGVMKYERIIMLALFALLYSGVLNGALSYLVNGLMSIENTLTLHIDAIFKRMLLTA